MATLRQCWLVILLAAAVLCLPSFAGQVAVPATRQAASVAILPIHGPIDDVTVKSLERRVNEAVLGGANAIVFELNTPGGDLYATLQLCHLIKRQFPANTVAWVRPQAYSAGVILSLACREIIMAPGAAMGDAAPIQVLPGMGLSPLPATERAKLEAPVISEVIDSARLRGYDENLVQSFVRLGTETWLIRNSSTGKRAIVDAEEYRALFGEEPPRQAVSAVPPEALLEDSEIEQFSPMIGGLSEREVIESPSAPPVRRTRIDPSTKAEWSLVDQVAKADQLLVVRSDDARPLGLSKATIADEQALAAWFGATRLSRYEESWSEHAVRFLTSWPVRIVLIVIFLVGIVVESLTPGGILFGSIGAAALLLLIGAPALIGMAQWWEFVAILLGLALVALDIVVLPMGGWIAIVGGALVLGGLVSSFVTRDISSTEGQHQLIVGIGSTLAALFGSAVTLWALWKHLPESRLARMATLEATMAPGPSTARPSSVPLPSVGMVAIAATDLRPSGKIDFGGRLLDACTTGEYVNARNRVRVVRASASMIEVEPIIGDSVPDQTSSP